MECSAENIAVWLIVFRAIAGRPDDGETKFGAVTVENVRQIKGQRLDADPARLRRACTKIEQSLLEPDALLCERPSLAEHEGRRIADADKPIGRPRIADSLKLAETRWVFCERKENVLGAGADSLNDFVEPFGLNVLPEQVRHGINKDAARLCVRANFGQFIRMPCYVRESSGICFSREIGGNSLGVANGNIAIGHDPATPVSAAAHGIGGVTRSWPKIMRPLNATAGILFVTLPVHKSLAASRHR